MHIKYRPEIDGLRAVAILSVIFYHAQITIYSFQPFKGGFVGVDIFFVISGYLITSIILNELITTKAFLFKNFYKRRIRRVLPALLFVMISSLPFAWIALYPLDFVSFSKSIIYSLGFSSNFFFHYSGLEYGSPESIYKPFLHTWSLSVEEQYYIFFPFLMFIAFKYFKKYFFLILLLGFLLSLSFADWGSKNYPSLTFYFLHTRFWELLAGSLLAYMQINFSNMYQYNLLNKIFPSIGLFLIGYSVVFFNDNTSHPSLNTLVPVIGASLVIWFTNKKNDVITKILSSRLFVGCGLISYSLYLWHYPIFSFAHHFGIDFNAAEVKLLLIALAIALSVFTYFFIEQPARKTIRFKLVFFILLLGAFVIAFFAILVVEQNGFSSRIKVKNYQDKNTFLYLRQNNEVCFGKINNPCQFGSKEKKIILLGDSQFASLSFDLNNRIKNDYTFLPLTDAAFFYLRNSKLINKHNKKINTAYEEKRNIIGKILKNSKNNIIILGGATSLYFYNKRVEGRALHWDNEFVDSQSLKHDPKSIKNDFLNLIKDLSVNNHVILVYPMIELGKDMQKKKFTHMFRLYTFNYSDFLKQNKDVINFFDSIKSSKIYKVFPHKVFCDENTNKCLTHNAENFFFFDGYHPSLKGAEMINDLIIREINEIENSE